MQPKISLSQFAMTVAISISLLLVAACGGNTASSTGGATDSSGENSDQPVVATMPPAQFTAVANQSVTKTMGVTTTQAVTAPVAVSASAEDLDRGARSYTKNKCNECHGEKGEGMAGKTTKTIAGTARSAEQFDNFLRTGGGLGNDHIFGPSAISPGGMTVLYAYVKSLSGK